MRFGVAGYPPAFYTTPHKRDRLKIVQWVADLGLDALELQMTYGPRTSPDVCRQYRQAAEDHNVALSVHASYYIVFTSSDDKKLENSRDTLKRTYELCSILGAKQIVLHPGPLYGEPEDTVKRRFIDNLGECLLSMGPRESSLFLETAGKRGQLGSVDEVIEMCRPFDRVYPCIDFGHVHARSLGTLDNYESIEALLASLLSAGFLREQRLHLHYTPICFGPKGEISHKAIHDRQPRSDQLSLVMDDEQSAPSIDGDLYGPRYEPVVRALKRFRVDCTLISETHNSQEEGALALKRAFDLEE